MSDCNDQNQHTWWLPEQRKRKKKKERRENWREFVQAWLIACVTKQIAYDVVCMCVYNEKERDRLFPVFKSTTCVRVKKKKKMGKKKYIDNSELFMHERQWFFFLYARTPYFFFLHSPRFAPCICMRVSNDAIQNAIDERATRIWREREWRRRSLFIMWNESHSSPFFFSLSLLIANADAFSLSLSFRHIIKQPCPPYVNL